MEKQQRIIIQPYDNINSDKVMYVATEAIKYFKNHESRDVLSTYTDKENGKTIICWTRNNGKSIKIDIYYEESKNNTNSI